MHSTLVKTCPNCGADLESDFRYCPHCTQSTHLHRFTLSHIAHELIHVVTHADKSIFSLIRDLAVRPGHVAREYVLEDKRKKYFNPFTLLVLVLGLTLLLNSYYKPYSKMADEQSKGFAVRKGDSLKKQQFSKEVDIRQRQMMNFVETQTKWLVFLSIPIMAFVFWLFFRRSGVHYAEHLMVNIIFGCFTYLISALSVAVHGAAGWLISSGPSLFLHTLIPVLFIGWGYYQFYQYKRPVLLLKTGLASLLAMLTVQFVVMIITAVYLSIGLVDKL